MTDAAPRLAALAETLLGAPLPVRIRAWDGSEAGPAAAPPWCSTTGAPCATCCGSRANWAWPAPGWPVT